jgi:hypothetical protein
MQYLPLLSAESQVTLMGGHPVITQTRIIRIMTVI